MALKVGADPEVFIRDVKGKQYVSAHTFMPGNKVQPHKVTDGAMQLDGTAAEFNIDPATTAEDFAAKVGSVLKQVSALCPEGHRLAFVPAIYYGDKYFSEIPEEHRQLGCDPDFNAYSGKLNVMPPEKQVGPLRTASGHLHLGWTEDMDPKSPAHFEDCTLMVKALDRTFEYVRFLWDKDTTRQALYGARGAFRPKPYGVEYRVLSNAWLAYPEMWQWLFKMVEYTYTTLLDKGEVPIITHSYGSCYYLSDRIAAIKQVNEQLGRLNLPLFEQGWVTRKKVSMAKE